MVIAMEIVGSHSKEKNAEGHSLHWLSKHIQRLPGSGSFGRANGPSSLANSLGGVEKSPFNKLWVLHIYSEPQFYTMLFE